MDKIHMWLERVKYLLLVRIGLWENPLKAHTLFISSDKSLDVTEESQVFLSTQNGLVIESTEASQVYISDNVSVEEFFRHYAVEICTQDSLKVNEVGHVLWLLCSTSLEISGLL